MEDKILCVDDDEQVLNAFQRHLRRAYDITTATSGEDGLETLAAHGPFAVVISDVRMPGMDGVRFLSRVRELYPDSVRMMLTGHADLPTAIDAINEGHIFRFLAKPCAVEVVTRAIDAALEQHRMASREHMLLKETLNGCINMLVDVLGLVNPTAFSRAMRIRNYTSQLATRMNLPDVWQFELAATLSQLGCVTVPAEVLERHFAGERLSPAEEEMMHAHPSTAAMLIHNIPRLEVITAMIEHQQQAPVKDIAILAADPKNFAQVGADILTVAIEFDLLLSRGIGQPEAINALAMEPAAYNASLVSLLPEVTVPEMQTVNCMVEMHDLQPGMVLGEDLYTESGLCFLRKGQEINPTLLYLLQHYFRNTYGQQAVRIAFTQGYNTVTEKSA